METKKLPGIAKTATITSLFTATLLMSNVFSAKAEGEVETTVGADIVSQYIWRGTDCGGVSIQPSLGVSYKGLSLGAWGSWDGSGTKEVDLTLAYSAGPLTIAVTDYWFDGDEVPYFEYGKNKTPHIFEGTVSADLGFISVSWNTCFAGSDYKEKDGKEKRAYSSYAEVAAPFTVGGIDWSAAIGVATNESSIYGTTGCKVTNISLGATKEIKFSDSFSLPLSAAVIANPNTDKVYLVATISF